jgi:hypothetical protein
LNTTMKEARVRLCQFIRLTPTKVEQTGHKRPVSVVIKWPPVFDQ